MYKTRARPSKYIMIVLGLLNGVQKFTFSPVSRPNFIWSVPKKPRPSQSISVKPYAFCLNSYHFVNVCYSYSHNYCYCSLSLRYVIVFDFFKPKLCLLISVIYLSSKCKVLFVVYFLLWFDHEWEDKSFDKSYDSFEVFSSSLIISSWFIDVMYRVSFYIWKTHSNISIKEESFINHLHN